MSIVRDVALILQALDDQSIITCSTANNSASTGNTIASSTAVSGISGRIIDRLGEPFLTERYTVAMPFAYLNSTRGSTEAARQMTIGVKLQHGSSSAGGDMADYSTGSAPTDVVLFSTAQTTPMYNWSTGTIKAQSAPCYYDLRGANRYIRAVVSASKNKVTTETSGDEGFHVGAAIALLGVDQFPQRVYSGAGSTSTSTST